MKKLLHLSSLILSCIILNGCLKKAETFSIYQPPSIPVDQKAVFYLLPSGNDCMDAYIDGRYEVGTPMMDLNTITISVYVTRAGSWSITTNTENDLNFIGLGFFESQGPDKIILHGSGIPSAAGKCTYYIPSISWLCGFDINITKN